jgi:hypothetical protein
MSDNGSIPGAFSWRTIEMLESPAHRVLSLSALRALARLEIEFGHHGGKPKENGKLPCTYEHFVEFGLHRHPIAPAIRELVALGFVEITRQGCAGNAGFRQPALYRLTYRHAGASKRITDDWRRIKTLDEAEVTAQRARSPQSGRASKTKARWRKSSLAPVTENGTETANPQCRKPALSAVAETITTSISRVGTRPETDSAGQPDRRLTPRDLAPPDAEALTSAWVDASQSQIVRTTFAPSVEGEDPRFPWVISSYRFTRSSRAVLARSPSTTTFPMTGLSA